MRKILLISLFILSFYPSLQANEKSIVLKFKVNEDLITNYDIIREAKYLKALNIDLQSVNQNQLKEFAKNSLIKEKIKKREIEKYYKVNYSSAAVDTYIDKFMKDLGINNKEEFETYLLDYETNINEIRKKLVIEQTWNKMIFDIYNTRISIDEKKISKTLEQLINEKKVQKSFELYEIFFSGNNKDELKKKYDIIVLSIKNDGFNKAALIHSVSNTSSSGGKIGWVNQNQLSKKFLNEILNLEIGSHTKPINTGGGSIILKLNDIKEISVENINKELELSKIISSEKNRQLNEFSVVHYKKIENKSYVEKF